jgi:phage host-nuclease inhibitor protein Gam
MNDHQLDQPATRRDLQEAITEVKSDFWEKMEELEREVARLQTAVDECCQAISEFKANL